MSRYVTRGGGRSVRGTRHWKFDRGGGDGTGSLPQQLASGGPARPITSAWSAGATNASVHKAP